MNLIHIFKIKLCVFTSNTDSMVPGLTITLMETSLKLKNPFYFLFVETVHASKTKHMFIQHLTAPKSGVGNTKKSLLLSSYTRIPHTLFTNEKCSIVVNNQFCFAFQAEKLARDNSIKTVLFSYFPIKVEVAVKDLPLQYRSEGAGGDNICAKVDGTVSQILC